MTAKVPDWKSISTIVETMDHLDARVGLNLRRSLHHLRLDASTEAAFVNWNETLKSLEQALAESRPAPVLKDLRRDCLQALEELRVAAGGAERSPALETITHRSWGRVS